METNILRQIGTIARSLDSISNIEFNQLNLAKGQYIYLARICENQGIILEHLAQMLKVDKTTVARSLNKLEANGFIEKRQGETNKKNKLLFPTKLGLETYPHIIREQEYTTNVAFTNIDPSDIETTIKTLNQIINNIDGDWEFVKRGGHRDY